MADTLSFRVVPATAGDGSTQAADTEDLYGTPDDCIGPPESLEQLAEWSKINGTRKVCVEAVARNTVGLGFSLKVAEGHEREVTDPTARIREATERLMALSARDTRLESPTFSDQMYAVKSDEEEIGNGYLEVSRRRTDGQISGLYHVPAKRVRRLKDRSGYVVLPPDGDVTRGVRFVNFGEKVEYDSRGRPTRRLRKGASWATNEIIAFRLYTSESRDYGLPRDVSLALEYLGDKYAAEANIGFFDSSGTPPTVLFVQGEERKDGSTIQVRVPAETSRAISSTLRGGAGRAQSRVAVVPLPAGTKVTNVPLGSASERDIGFTAFRDDMRQRTLSAFRLSPIFIALASDGTYGAEVDRAITKEQVFDPEQERWSTRLTRTLLADMGYGDLEIEFTDLAIEDDAAKRASADSMAQVGNVMTRREYRAAYGYGPLPEAAEGADPAPGQVPFGWNDELVTAQGTPAVQPGDSQQGLRPGIGGRGTRDDGQAASAAKVEAQVRRLAQRSGAAGRGGAQRALQRARTLPAG